MKLIISKEDLLIVPCERYYNLPDTEFDAIEEILKRWSQYDGLENIGYTTDLLWLIMNCEKARIDEVFEFFYQIEKNSNDYTYCRVLYKKIPQVKEYFDRMGYKL